MIVIDQSLSLFQIESELLELVSLREDMIEAGEDTTACDEQIAEYVRREVRKVDSIRGFLRHCDMMAGAAKEEASRQLARVKAWEGRRDRLKEICKLVMEQAGAKKLEGRTGSLLLKANGGKQSVAITAADLIPEELVQYSGTISGHAWDALGNIIHPDLKVGAHSARTWWFGRQDVQMERIPHKGRIAEALSGRCKNCGGSGNYPAIDREGHGTIPCTSCDGDGKARVPGAHFEARGNHMEVK